VTEDELAALMSALESLPERQRRALLLREWRQLSYCEIAAELGVSRPYVARLLYRARRSLVRRLALPTRRRCGRVAIRRRA
jgi:RNA polymerase sigma-70 factor, ECF subfamily